ncbi:uncharacterized protein JN550_003227 [Neoarthrinium moseri]|uniref:uncharacterized protein n=1 Tax=Neoarthrinium moseri TaxID=1658444 RepID=UPI001FDB688B|nr:uncharacterized protein JN550_003227 [Neoarthrinium moseri]KAI1873958.1 hypothetical protein JN550_003227 [Neoarthrinium moseri]
MKLFILLIGALAAAVRADSLSYVYGNGTEVPAASTAPAGHTHSSHSGGHIPTTPATSISVAVPSVTMSPIHTETFQASTSSVSITASHSHGNNTRKPFTHKTPPHHPKPTGTGKSIPVHHQHTTQQPEPTAVPKSTPVDPERSSQHPKPPGTLKSTPADPEHSSHHHRPTGPPETTVTFVGPHHDSLHPKPTGTIGSTIITRPGGHTSDPQPPHTTTIPKPTDAPSPQCIDSYCEGICHCSPDGKHVMCNAGFAIIPSLRSCRCPNQTGKAHSHTRQVTWTASACNSKLEDCSTLTGTVSSETDSTTLPYTTVSSSSSTSSGGMVSLPFGISPTISFDPPFTSSTFSTSTTSAKTIITTSSDASKQDPTKTDSAIVSYTSDSTASPSPSAPGWHVHCSDRCRQWCVCSADGALMCSSEGFHCQAECSCSQ